MKFDKKFFSIVLILILFIQLMSCSQKESDTPLNGEELSRIHCVSCHSYPDPSLLDKKTWEKYVIPRMGNFLGIYKDETERYELIEGGLAKEKVEKANIFPKEPLIDMGKWEAIRDYYLQNSPEKLESSPYLAIDSVLTQFKVHTPSYRLSPPSTTLMSIQNDGTFFLGDANSKTLYQFDKDLKLKNAARVKEGAVHLSNTPDDLKITVMGSFSPTDAPSGFLMKLPKNKTQKPKKLIDRLQRPVHAAYADLDGDGLEDIVISEFAKWTGSLAWWKNMGNDTFQKNYLRNRTGAVRAEIIDLNNDGLLDVVGLFGQGDEGIWAFYNQGEGKFKQKKIVELTPSHGSCFFSMQDLNDDGLPDIVYTAGDNADFPPVLKPYHGIYFFTNDGKGNFAQSFFQPMNGAYAAIPADFDLDGDLDIAAISFFPDFKNRPGESFLYFENNGDFSFKASTLPDPTLGRWIVMDAGDLDGDGDLDLLLGSLGFEVVPPMGLVEKWVGSGIPFLYLENTAK